MTDLSNGDFNKLRPGAQPPRAANVNKDGKAAKSPDTANQEAKADAVFGATETQLSAEAVFKHMADAASQQAQTLRFAGQMESFNRVFEGYVDRAAKVIEEDNLNLSPSAAKSVAETAALRYINHLMDQEPAFQG